MFQSNDLFSIGGYPSEQPCEVFEGEFAYQMAMDLGMPDIQTLHDGVQKGDDDRALKTRFNPAVGICRWDAIVGDIALNTQDVWVFSKINGQPCITSQKRNIRIIFMSGNDAIGDSTSPLSSNHPKGRQTETHILANQANYDDVSQMRTWVFYYPALTHACYHADSVPIRIELAYPKSFIKLKKGKVSPTHICRLIFEISDGSFKYKVPTNPETSFEITEDDFNFKVS